MHILNWENNRELWHLSDTTTPYTYDDIWKLVYDMGDFHSQGQLRYMICDHSGKRIGLIDLFGYNTNDHSAWLGILIAKNENRGLGYGSDALKEWLSYAERLLKVKIFRAKVFNDNAISLRLFTKLGFASSPDKEDARCDYFELNHSVR